MNALMKFSRTHRRRKGPLLALLFLTATTSFGAPRALERAHAHNDYEHNRPLLDALSRGFCSVEADVFLVGDDLLVGHEEEELRPERTLRSLYLDPLRSRVRSENGTVTPGCNFTLLVDVKSEASSTWAVLNSQLAAYRDLLTVFTDNGVRQGAVTVVISGNRAASAVLSEPTRLAGLDGRIADITLGLPPEVMPWISDNFTHYINWSGEVEIPADERRLLAQIVKESHRKGYRLRFWATPDSPAVWQELISAGVDIIGTDDLEGLGQFLLTDGLN